LQTFWVYFAAKKRSLERLLVYQTFDYSLSFSLAVFTMDCQKVRYESRPIMLEGYNFHR